MKLQVTTMRFTITKFKGFSIQSDQILHLCVQITNELFNSRANHYARYILCLIIIFID